MPESNLSTALEYCQQNRGRFLEELKSLISIPSISTDPNARPGIQRAAQWLADHLEHLGMKNVQILPTPGHPVVYGESLDAGPGKPIILIYGHYDVQPAEPLDLWHSPAFEPELRGDNLYGRGASDMKGQVLATLKAVESITKTGSLNINLKFLFEGEEEIGSPNLGPFIAVNTELLACDFALNPDAAMIAADIPTITYGLRGLAYFELRISGPRQDLHSGLYGGVVHNPAQALCELLSGMHDAQGRVTLPSFYDSVQPLSEEERDELRRLPIDDQYYLEQCGAPQLSGEAGFSALERVGARPTLEINGLLSGFTSEGIKTVLPAKAMAKISMRLVPDQDPTEVHQQLVRYMEMNAPSTVTWEVIKMAGSPPSITDRQMPAMEALSQALQETWGKKPVYKREGGSIPVVAQLSEFLGVDSIITGFGLPDDNLHAPNEKLNLPNFFRSVEALTRFFCILGEQ